VRNWKISQMITLHVTLQSLLEISQLVVFRDSLHHFPSLNSTAHPLDDHFSGASPVILDVVSATICSS
jgi:hypothetical protein